MANGRMQIAIGSFLEGLTPLERRDLFLTVHFADSDPSIHPTWNQSWLPTLVDATYFYNVSLPRLTQLRRLESTHNFKEKSIVDYTYAMEQCYAQGAPYIAMFEDDIIAADGWLSQTIAGVLDAEAMAKDAANNWLYMRLFNQERSTGWKSRNIGANNEHWISLGVDVAVIGTLLALRRRSRAAKSHLDHWTLAILGLVVVRAASSSSSKSARPPSCLPPPASGKSVSAAARRAWSSRATRSPASSTTCAAAAPARSTS